MESSVSDRRHVAENEERISTEFAVNEFMKVCIISLVSNRGSQTSASVYCFFTKGAKDVFGYTLYRALFVELSRVHMHLPLTC